MKTYSMESTLDHDRYNASRCSPDRHLESQRLSPKTAHDDGTTIDDSCYKDAASIGITCDYAAKIDIKHDDIPVGLLTKEGEQLSAGSEGRRLPVNCPWGGRPH
jgi:hypothetical protein